MAPCIGTADSLEADSLEEATRKQRSQTINWSNHSCLTLIHCFVHAGLTCASRTQGVSEPMALNCTERRQQTSGTRTRETQRVRHPEQTDWSLCMQEDT